MSTEPNQQSLVLGIDELVPTLDDNAWLAPGSRVLGDVMVGAHTSIWYGAVVRADREAIRIGSRCNLQYNAVIHADPGYPATVGDEVSVGHAAVLHGCTIGEGTLVGMGAIVMNGATIGSECIIAAGTVVLEDTDVAEGSLVAGVPGRVRRELSDDERERNRSTARTYVDQLRRHRDALEAAPTNP